jgi:hypothetical protein
MKPQDTFSAGHRQSARIRRWMRAESPLQGAHPGGLFSQAPLHRCLSHSAHIVLAACNILPQSLHCYVVDGGGDAHTQRTMRSITLGTLSSTFTLLML